MKKTDSFAGAFTLTTNSSMAACFPACISIKSWSHLPTWSDRMIIYPAIDLKDGNCVRLVRGDMEKATVFSESPAEQAKSFEAAGFRWLHLVDLNGAFEG